MRVQQVGRLHVADASISLEGTWFGGTTNYIGESRIFAAARRSAS
jgi:hypothetical protein